MSNYPTSQDDSSTLPNPIAGNFTTAPDHAVLHSTENDAIKALEAKLGTGASTATNNTLLRGTGTGTTAFAQANLTTDVTGTLPVANGGTGVTASTGTGSVVRNNSPALVTPTGIVKGDVGLGNVDNTSDTTKNAASVTLTNKTMDGGSNTFTNIPSSAIVTGAWQSWTPTFTNWTIGTGGLAGTTAAYVQIGKIVHFYIVSVLGTSGQSVGTIVQFTLPVTASTAIAQLPSPGVAIGVTTMVAAGSQFTGLVIMQSTTKAGIVNQSATGSFTSLVAVTATQPATWAAGDKFQCSGTYEAA